MWTRISLASLGLVLATGLHQPAYATALTSVWAYAHSSTLGYFEHMADSPASATAAYAKGTAIDNSSGTGGASAGSGTLDCGGPGQPLCFSTGANNGQSRGFAEANGAKGSLRAFASADAQAGTGAKAVSTRATLQDTITFHGAPTITIDLDLSRSLGGNDAFHTFGFFMQHCPGGDCSFGGIDLLSIAILQGKDPVFGDDKSFTLRRYDDLGNPVVIQSNTDIPDHLVLELDLSDYLGSDATLDIVAWMTASAEAEDGSTIVRADQTAYLGIEDYSSASGYNYAGRQAIDPDPDPVPVPAPPSLLLLATGLAGLGWRAVRQAKRA
jgi:hypothetical protein